MIHLLLKVRLTLVGPILTQAMSAGAVGVDAAMARDGQDRPYLPYSLVRGKLRQALEELTDALSGADSIVAKAETQRWFGPRGDTDHANERGSLFFSDFVHPLSRPEDQLLSRIKMDPETHAAQGRMLMVIDTPFGYGELADFVGEIRGVCMDVAHVEESVQLLWGAVHRLDQLGAERSVGFGRVETVQFEHIQLTDLAAPLGTMPTVVPSTSLAALAALTNSSLSVTAGTAASASSKGANRFAVRIRPHAPFFLGGKRTRMNVFESVEHIRGNVLLGTIASMYCMATTRTPSGNAVQEIAGKPWQTLARHFGKLRFSHAFPTALGTSVRPMVWPLSLVAAEPTADDMPVKLHDVALCQEPRMVPFGADLRPPVFASDWKSHAVTESAKATFGWPDVRSQLRVRTAIDSTTLRADDAKLFAYQMIEPEGLEWLGTLDISRVPAADQDSVLAELRSLLAVGLWPLGKTKVDADICIEPDGSFTPRVPSSTAPLPGNRWILTLQSSAILCARDDMDTADPRKLWIGYNRVFQELSGGALALERFFAKQSLSSVRFAGRWPTDASGAYYPLILTDEGSTFVLQCEDADVERAQGKIQEWLDFGLPLVASLVPSLPVGFDAGSDVAWKLCPILNRHGFGEIVVNTPWQRGEVHPDWPTLLLDDAHE